AVHRQLVGPGVLVADLREPLDLAGGRIETPHVRVRRRADVHVAVVGGHGVVAGGGVDLEVVDGDLVTRVRVEHAQADDALSGIVAGGDVHPSLEVGGPAYRCGQRRRPLDDGGEVRTAAGWRGAGTGGDGGSGQRGGGQGAAA